MFGNERIEQNDTYFLFVFIKSYEATKLKIRAGEWDTQSTKEILPHQNRNASRIFSHPNYNERTLINDFVSLI